MEILDRTGTEQPLVVEGLDQRQDDLSVDVVLKVLASLIADAHRLHAAIAGDRLGDPLVDVLLQPVAMRLLTSRSLIWLSPAGALFRSAA